MDEQEPRLRQAAIHEFAEVIDHMGADAQVGMALYKGHLGLADAIAAPLRSDRPDGLWPTVVTDEQGVALGLVYSNAESLRECRKAQNLRENLTESVRTIQEAGIEQVRIRSVLTCETRRGVCQLCYGRNLATGRSVERGEAADVGALLHDGLNAAQDDVVE